MVKYNDLIFRKNPRCTRWDFPEMNTPSDILSELISHDPDAWHAPVEKIRAAQFNTQEMIAAVCDEIKKILLQKNAEYGDSAINPKRIFSAADPLEQINVRIDDKLSRIANRKEKTIPEDTELDLIGYLILKRVATKRIRG